MTDEWTHSTDDGRGYTNNTNSKDMTDNEVIDFILGLFTDNEMPKDDIHYAIEEKFNYNSKPILILKRLINEGLITEMGEAYYSLSVEGRKAQKGYDKYIKRQKFWQYIDKANKVSTLVKCLYGIGGFAAGWLAKALAYTLGF